MALRRAAIPSPNYGSRGGKQVRLIIMHTAEGATTYQSLGNFFSSKSSGVSSHVGIDDNKGVVGEYVGRPGSAWTAGNYNPVAVQAELCAFAKWDAAEWRRHPNMLANAAEWIAEEARHFNLPLTRLTPSQAQGSGRGVCQHVDVSGPGGHWDCGPGFPLDDVLRMARDGAPPITAPPPATGKAPPYPGRLLKQGVKGDDVRQWQAKMRERNWAIDIDGIYGPQSENYCKQFQRNKNLDADGIVGPVTWDATWTTPVT